MWHFIYLLNKQMKTEHVFLTKLGPYVFLRALAH